MTLSRFIFVGSKVRVIAAFEQVHDTHDTCSLLLIVLASAVSPEHSLSHITYGRMCQAKH